jgi:hypothetical protein
MVKDPGAGAPINIDTRAAVGAVTLDVRGAMAADLGQAKMGEAIADAGSSLTQLAVKQMQAINVTKVAEAQDIMTEAESTMKVAMLKEPDELKWEGIATEYATQAQSRISKMALSPVAKQQVDSDFSRWQAHRTGQVKVDSARQSFDKVTTKLKNQLLLNMERQDPEGFADNLQGGLDLGILTDEDVALEQIKYTERGEQLKKKYEADNEKTTLEGVLGTAQNDPDEAEKIVNAKGFGTGMSPMVKERAKDIIRGVRRDTFADVQQAVYDGIAKQDIKTDTDIDRVINSVAPKGVNEADRLYLKDKLKEFNTAAMKETALRPEVISERFGRLLEAVDAYDRDGYGGSDSKASRDAYAAIIMEAGLLPIELRGEITGPLGQKWRDGGIGINGTVKDYVDESIKDLYDNGGFGATTMKGKSLIGKDAVVTDVEGQKLARARRADAAIAMKQWIKDHPNATRLEATGAIYQLSGQSMNAEDAAALLNAANRQTTAPAGTTGTVDWTGLSNKLSGKTDNVRGFSEAGSLKDTLPAGLKPHAQDYIDAAKEHGLNPRVLAAISALETGGGTSNAFRNKRNAMGISDSSGPTEQPSVRDSIFRQAKTLSKAEGPYAKAKTIEEIGAIYAPPGAENDPKGTNGGWADGVRAWLSRL